MRNAVVITGANGGIGSALCATFAAEGWYVVATDAQPAAKSRCDAYVQIDLDRFAMDETLRTGKLNELKNSAGGNLIRALVNNAALQIVARVEDLAAEDLRATLNVNLVAPFLMIKGLLSDLEEAGGSVVNIASIHAQLTKPEFSAYATSKAGLVGLTRGLAVELGARVRVNAIAPAAIATEMLVASFAGRQEEFRRLQGMHPAGTIGRPEEVARAALFLCTENSGFLNGCILGVDGGIASRLHDPV